MPRGPVVGNMTAEDFSIPYTLEDDENGQARRGIKTDVSGSHPVPTKVPIDDRGGN